MSKGELVVAIAVGLALAGCGAAKPPAGAAMAMGTDQPIAKGIVKDGLYVNSAGVPLCPVTGAPIAKGKEVGKTTYHGVEYHFCCAGCPDDFKSTPAKYAAK